MAFDLFSHGKNPFLHSKKITNLVFGIILGLSFLFFIRGCSFNNHPDRTFLIGQDSRWAALNLMGKERNLTAFNNELLSAIAKQENFSIRIDIIPAADLIRDLEEGTLQGVLTSVQPSYLTEENLIFSNPYFHIGPVLIIPSTARIEGWNDNSKKIVGIPFYSPILTSLEEDPTIQTKIYDDILHALSDLSAHKIDGAIFPAIPANTYVRTFYKHELKIATLPLTDEAIRLAALKNEKGVMLIELFNKGLAALKKDETYDKFLDRWSLINVEKIEQK